MGDVWGPIRPGIANRGRMNDEAVHAAPPSDPLPEGLGLPSIEPSPPSLPIIPEVTHVRNDARRSRRS
jgi:hypothetical protein